MENLGHLLEGFGTALTLENLGYAVVGSLLGTMTGILPGLGPTAAIAILLPLTAILPPTGAIIMLAAIYYGSQYGGSITAILLKIPGEVSSVPSVLDGYPAAKKGDGGPALVIAAVGSFVAGTIGLVFLTFFAPLMAEVSLAFGPPEYFALIVLALTTVAALSGRSIIRGLTSAALGFLIGMVGLDPLTGDPRLTFGQPVLLAGIDFVAAAVGLFAISEVLVNASETEAATRAAEKIRRFLPSRSEMRQVIAPILRGSGIGIVLGVLPGIGSAVVSFLSYDVEKRVSKHPERFGQGALEGVAGPESANNGATSSGFVPLFAFGIPPTSGLAVLLGALLIYGLQPGPLLFQQRPDFVWALIASMYVGNVILLILNIPLVRVWTLVLKVPQGVLMPLIVLFSVVGAISIRGSFFDVWVMLAFGLLGYIMTRTSFPLAPLVLTLLLGPRLEAEFRRTLVLAGGSPSYLLERPIAIALLFIFVVTIGVVIWRRIVSQPEHEGEVMPHEME